MKRLAALLLFALAGCETLAEPAVVVREVPVPVPAVCIDPAHIPPEPPTVSQRFNGDAKHDLQILAPNAQALRKWGRDLQALLASCAGAPAADAEAADAADEGETATDGTPDGEAD